MRKEKRMLEKKTEDPLPDRPLECSACRRAIAVRYTEMTKEATVETSMCAECPELQKRLCGSHSSEQLDNSLSDAELVCGTCGTNLEQVRRGQLLGCSECYELFADALIQELHALNRLSPKIAKDKKSGPIHVGRGPGEQLNVNLSSKLSALNEMLKETLRREDYEQAALLRDQIQALTHEEKTKNLPQNDSKEKEQP